MALAPADIVVDAATRKAQAEASNPAGSAWVSANAGSGKTFVLSQRVVRLLLAGADPGRILCLTFTKAAAAQMATKVFERLSKWATASDRALGKELRDLEGRAMEPADLARARRLFARALETPGGLKIQTIHAFCERLLHQFPFEANVAGHFEVLDERDADALAETARRSVLARAAREPDGPFGKALATVLASGSDTAHELAIKEFVDKRDRLRAWIVAAGSLADALVDLRTRLGIGAAETPESLRAALLTESLFTAADLRRLAGLLGEGGKGDRDAADRLQPALTGDGEEERIAGYLDFCQTGGGDMRVAGRLVSNAVKTRWPGLDQVIEKEFARLKTLLDRVAAAECYASTAAMLCLADAAIGEYDRLKIARGVLDFEDLVVKTANLFLRRDASAWVHYKLDRGLDHILVDEAQDTSPRQWQVVQALVEEFFAGEGASDRLRTLFAVGDEKQSIFSFQGAVPAWFSRMRRELGERARAAGFAWANPELHLSFRSAEPVLSAIDAVFANESVYVALSEDKAAPTHSAARRNAPGRVIIWPMIEAEKEVEPEDWTKPVDHLGKASPEVRLAHRIAQTIARWIHHGETLDTGAPIRAGSILVLCRTRGAQTDAINRALKTKGVAIAGADRLALTDHIAVMDLVALGRVMLLPEDDLALAALLKSPLIGLGEDDLYELAYGRDKRTLWDALGEAAGKGERFDAARAKLDAWRSLADYRDPHAFFARILGPERGRLKIMQRLGAEAEDVLDEFLAQALAYEKQNVPSLQGFLAWLDSATTEIKRDTGTLRDAVRVMTVHGAKGLEADVVFLVDTGSAPVHPSHDPKVVALDDDRDGTVSPLVWMRRKKAMPAIVEARVNALRAEAREEYLRLLYVAMTRARDRLIICGTLKERGTDMVGGWHALVRTALEPECEKHEAADGSVELEWRPEPRVAAKTKPSQPALPLGPHRPTWVDTRAAPPPPAPRRLTPSTALGEVEERLPPAVALRVAAAAETARERGRLIHRLLQSLPDIAPEARAATGARYLAASAPAWSEADREALLTPILAILTGGGFAPVFAEGSRAEVDVAGLLPIAGGNAVLSGRIDRLAVTPDRVLVIDYKTNRPAPEKLADIPQTYVVQLALYRRLLQRLYPNKMVAAAILWTDAPSLMEIPSSTLDAAVAEVMAG
jgi:ATP-dependent helicase/nuclease subunit A